MTAARNLARHSQMWADGAWHTIDAVFELDGQVAVLVDGIVDGGYVFGPDHDIPTR